MENTENDQTFLRSPPENINEMLISFKSLNQEVI